MRKLGKLAALLPATELGGARVPEEGCELLPGDTPLPPRDPESIRDGQGMDAHKHIRLRRISPSSVVCIGMRHKTENIAAYRKDKKKTQPSGWVTPHILLADARLMHNAETAHAPHVRRAGQDPDNSGRWYRAAHVRAVL